MSKREWQYGKPESGYIVTRPDGMPLRYTFSGTRSGALQAFLNALSPAGYAHGLSWASYKARGWKIIRATITIENNEKESV